MHKEPETFVHNFSVASTKVAAAVAEAAAMANEKAHRIERRIAEPR